jgi:hypothetical protein
VRILCACNYIGNACRFLFRCGECRGLRLWKFGRADAGAGDWRFLGCDKFRVGTGAGQVLVVPMGAPSVLEQRV